ncbi:MAG: glycosyltransferase, partial [Polyangiaceae bacterium]
GAAVEVLALRGPAFGWPGVAAHVNRNPLLALSASAEVAHMSAVMRRKGPFSRVIAHWAIPSAWPIAGGASNLEVVSHGGDVRLLKRLPGLVRRALVKRIMQNASIWRFASESLRSDLVASLDGDLRARLEKIALVRAPAIAIMVAADAVARARAEQKSRARGQKVFAVAARLVASKNIDRAIAYAAKENAMLLVIGDGPERAKLEVFAKESHANAYFLGTLSRPETLAHIAAADALVHMSDAEGLSSVVREADALGTLVITEL